MRASGAEIQCGDWGEGLGGGIGGSDCASLSGRDGREVISTEAGLITLGCGSEAV